MTLTIKKIGNSQGIILPKQLMAMCSITNKVMVTVENNQIIIAAIDNPREGWDAQFKAAIASGDLPEQDIFESFENDFDNIEWKW